MAVNKIGICNELDIAFNEHASPSLRRVVHLSCRQQSIFKRSIVVLSSFKDSFCSVRNKLE